jgi:hypothetical protein
MDIHTAFQEGPGLQEEGSGQLVPFLQYRPGKRTGYKRRMRKMRYEGYAKGAGAMVFQNYRLHRAIA